MENGERVCGADKTALKTSPGFTGGILIAPRGPAYLPWVVINTAAAIKSPVRPPSRAGGALSRLLLLLLLLEGKDGS